MIKYSLQHHSFVTKHASNCFSLCLFVLYMPRHWVVLVILRNFSLSKFQLVHKVNWRKNDDSELNLLKRWLGSHTWYLSFSQILYLRLTFVLFKGALSSLRQFLATESPLKMMKTAFYFTLKALFLFKIFKLLSWLFGHVEKRLDWG